MKNYESTMTFRFKEHNWNIAQKSNVKLYKMLIEVCKALDIEVNCKKLKELEQENQELEQENQELKKKVESMAKELCNCEEDYIYEEYY